jgi:hypothetical protein
VAPRYDRSIPIHWAQLPYRGGVDGPEETVELTSPSGTPWLYTARSVRNYDLGACGAFVTWSQLATLVNAQFFRSFTSSVFAARVTLPASPLGLPFPTTVPQVTHAYNMLSELRLGPSFSGRGTLFRDDTVGMWFRTSSELAVADFTAGQNVYPYSNVFLSAYILTQANPTGPGRRLLINAAVGGSLSIPPDVLDTRRNISTSIADALRGSATTPGLAQTLADTVNQGLLQPFDIDPSTTNSYIRCGSTDIGSPNGIATCIRDVTPFDALISGTEFGCYPESAFPANLRTTLANDPARGDKNYGVCATRLQPMRVNILPDELEIVLVEREDTPVVGSPGLASRQEMREFFRTALASMTMSADSTQFRLSCDDRPDWNPASPPGHIAQSGTIGVPANNIQQCNTEAACNTFRPPGSP